MQVKLAFAYSILVLLFVGCAHDTSSEKGNTPRHIPVADLDPDVMLPGLLNVNGAPASFMLQYYGDYTGLKLVTSSNVNTVKARVTLQPQVALKRPEVVKALEKTLLEQAGIVITKLDDKQVSVTYNDALPITVVTNGRPIPPPRYWMRERRPADFEVRLTPDSLGVLTSIWNTSDQDLVLYRNNVPWLNRPCFHIAAFQINTLTHQANPLETKRFLIDSPTGDLTIRPGSFAAGVVNPWEDFPTLSAVLETNDVLAVWSFTLYGMEYETSVSRSTVKLPPEEFSGSFLVPRKSR